MRRMRGGELFRWLGDMKRLMKAWSWLYTTSSMDEGKWMQRGRNEEGGWMEVESAMSWRRGRGGGRTRRGWIGRGWKWGEERVRMVKKRLKGRRWGLIVWLRMKGRSIMWVMESKRQDDNLQTDSKLGKCAHQWIIIYPHIFDVEHYCCLQPGV